MRMFREESMARSLRKYKRMASDSAFVSSGDKERGNLPVKQPDWNDMARRANLREKPRKPSLPLGSSVPLREVALLVEQGAPYSESPPALTPQDYKKNHSSCMREHDAISAVVVAIFC